MGCIACQQHPSVVVPFDDPLMNPIGADFLHAVFLGAGDDALQFGSDGFRPGRIFDALVRVRVK